MMARDPRLDVRVGVVFARVVVAIPAHGLVRRDLLQPRVMILVQPGLVAVDER
jgi:hypothetical protein